MIKRLFDKYVPFYLAETVHFSLSVTAFPDVFKQYAKDCKKGLVQVGKMHVVEVHGLTAPKYVINFPTKVHWRHPSKLEYIQKGLIDLVKVVQDLEIKSIAIPPLGCGNGGLDWKKVRPLILEAFQPLNVEVHLYEPAGAPPLDKMTLMVPLLQVEHKISHSILVLMKGNLLK